MTVSKLPLIQKKYKTALFRRRILERLRLQTVTERQVLSELGISRTLLNQWNRTYQRYQHRWCRAACAVQARPFPRFVMKKPAVDPLQALQQKLADTEALLQQERLKNQALQTVIEIAEKEFKIPVVYHLFFTQKTITPVLGLIVTVDKNLNVISKLV